MAETQQSWFDEVLTDTKPIRDLVGIGTGIARTAGYAVPPGMGIASGGIGIYQGAGKVANGEVGSGLLDIGSGLGSIFKDGMTIAQQAGYGSGPGTAGQLIDVANGTRRMVGGLDSLSTPDEGYGGRTLDGIHEVLGGTADIAGGIGGSDTELGRIGQGFSLGMKVGDAIAPYVFHDAASAGTHTEAADGVYETTTGNADVDHVVHAVEDLGTGDYLGALGEGVQGLPFVAQMALNPTGAIATEALEGAVASLWE